MKMENNFFLKESAQPGKISKIPTPDKLKLLAKNKIQATERLLRILESIDENKVISTEINVRREYI